MLDTFAIIKDGLVVNIVKWNREADLFSDFNTYN